MTIERQGKNSFLYHIVSSFKCLLIYTLYNHAIKYLFHIELVSKCYKKRGKKLDVGILQEWQII